MNIREVQPTDAEAFLAHLKRFFAAPAPDNPISPHLFNPTVEQVADNLIENYILLENWLLLVAEQDGQIVGSVSCTGGSDETTMHSAELTIAIEQPYQEQGIGTALLDQAVVWAKKSGVITELRLEVYVDNDPARHLYEKMGFAVQSRKRKTQTETPARDVFIMQLGVS